MQGRKAALLLQILGIWHSHQGTGLKCDAENETGDGWAGKSRQGSEKDNKLNIRLSRILAGVSARTLLTIIVLLLLVCRFPACAAAAAADEACSAAVDAVFFYHLNLRFVFKCS